MSQSSIWAKSQNGIWAKSNRRKVAFWKLSQRILKGRKVAIEQSRKMPRWHLGNCRKAAFRAIIARGFIMRLTGILLYSANTGRTVGGRVSLWV